MIHNKKKLEEYLEQDKIALRRTDLKPKLFNDDIWKFQILLRKNEYYSNIKCNMIQIFVRSIVKYRFYKKSIELGFSIPINVFDSGLSIAHYGTIVVNGKAKIGKNCRIHENVTIGSTGGEELAPQIGNNVFIGTGAKIIGNIEIADNIAIGANSLVNKSFTEPGITIAGNPAKKISNNSSKMFINNQLRE